MAKIGFSNAKFKSYVAVRYKGRIYRVYNSNGELINGKWHFTYDIVPGNIHNLLEQEESDENWKAYDENVIKGVPEDQLELIPDLE